VRFSFAASSTLARQIEAGAPAQIYASANETWMDYLADRALIEPDSRISPVGNRLVLIAPVAGAADAVTITPDLDIAAMLGADGRLAVGDPAHVPAGIYAAQALKSLGLWDALAPRLARMGNVRAALALVEHGEAPLGIVYATDARITQGVRVVGTFPADSHPPITYPFAIVKGAGSDAVRALFAYITGAPGLAVLEAYGFSAN
jgi:molybdate transport system substrate-binding protein